MQYIYKKKRLIAGALPISNNGRSPFKKLKCNLASTDQQFPQPSLHDENDAKVKEEMQLSTTGCKLKVVQADIALLQAIISLHGEAHGQPHGEKTISYQENESEFPSSQTFTSESLVQAILNKKISVILSSTKWGIHMIESEIVFTELACIAVLTPVLGEINTHILCKKVRILFYLLF